MRFGPSPAHRRNLRAPAPHRRSARPAGWRDPRFQRLDDRENLFDEKRREAHRGFVEQKQFRVAIRRGRSPASAARRRIIGRRSATGAPSAAGNERARFPASIRCRRARADRRRREDFPRRSSARISAGPRGRARCVCAPPHAPRDWSGFRPRKRPFPARIFKRPERPRRIVVLPAPLAPIRQTICPARRRGRRP